MMSKFFKGIFGYFFIRASVIELCSSLILLAVILPFFDYIADDIAAEQGHTLSSSTITATSDNLYNSEYSLVIDYCMSIVKDTDNIEYIIFSKRDGEEFIIEENKWELKHKSLNHYKHAFKIDESTQYGARSHSISNNNSLQNSAKIFEYNRPVYIGSKEWGVLTIGFSRVAYLEYITLFYVTIILVTIATCLLALYSFFASSTKIRSQIGQFETAATELSAGKLSARAPESSIGEIGTLGKAMNSMSASLEEKSERLFQFAQIVEQTNDAFVLFDQDLNIVFLNDAVTHDTAYPTSQLMGLSVHDFADKLHLDLTALLKEFNAVKQGQQHTAERDTALINANAEKLDIALRLELVEDPEQKTQHFLLVFSNISARKSLENELHDLAFIDKLTNLPNRRMFMDGLRNLIKFAERKQTQFALFFLDLDNFKDINDTLGHDIGDEFLVQVSTRLKESFRSEDLVCRLGGDEFTVLIEFKENEDHMLINVANKIITELSSKPIQVMNRKINVTTSIGIAQYPKDANNIDSLMRNADTAMYAAKKNGKNRFSFFSEEMIRIANERFELETAIKEALNNQQDIYLHYQPIIDLQDNKIVGVEALARWAHPVKGFVPPDVFIGIAEKSDLIVALSEYLLETAFHQASQWHSQNLAIYVSVNISVKHFSTDGFMAMLEKLINKYAIEPKDILLEFTESIMIDATETTITKFNQLKAMGFKIAIDDFGTGYSSLSYINQFPMDVIKIDKSFINAMMQNEKSNAIVAAIIKLSNALGMKTIAEGIEKIEESERLTRLECDLCQGYLYSKPISAAALETWMIEHNEQVNTLKIIKS